MNVRGKKIFVGLSGGVDSSVTAALLKKAGADVHGVFIQGWYPPDIPCTWREDRADAMRVAAHLGTPFTTLDASKEYKKYVIDYLIREYQAGRTPNPDIMCNKEVKFGAFYRFAREHGADFIATGHYARVEDGSILRGVDTAKDQSYFLWNIDKEVLPYILFPLGGYTKKHVRELAQEFKLPTAPKKDSQGICFLGTVSIEEFLAAEFPLQQGDILAEHGEVLGKHNGAALYTLGEHMPIPNSTHSWYVVAKDMERNTVRVASSAKRDNWLSNITVADSNLLAPVSPEVHIEAQYRYHGPVITGTFVSDSHEFRPTSPVEEYLAAGQSLVLYDGERMLGGAIIS